LIRAQGIDLAVCNQVTYDSAAAHDFVVVKVVNGSQVDATGSFFSPRRTYYDLLPEIEPVPVRGGYGYIRPTYVEPWRQQADAMIKAVQDAGEGFFHFLWADIEPLASHPMTAAWGQDARCWLEEVAQRCGIPVIPYTNPATYMALWQLKVRWMVTRPLAIAQYVYRSFNARILEALDTENGWQPYLPPYHEGGWLFWQCSADENAAAGWGAKHGVQSKAVDWDLFNGNRAALQRWVGLGGAPGAAVESQRNAVLDEAIAAVQALKEGV
jgi:hypothetical protein